MTELTRTTITNLNYERSITLEEDFMEAVNLTKVSEYILSITRMAKF